MVDFSKKAINDPEKTMTFNFSIILKIFHNLIKKISNLKKKKPSKT